MINGWSTCCLTGLEMEAHLCHVLLHEDSIDMLGKNVGRVSVPGNLLERNSFFLMRSWIHKSAVAKCLTLPSPLLLAMPIAAVASVMTVTSSRIPKSAARDCKPKDCAAPLHIPVNSASAEDKATVV